MEFDRSAIEAALDGWLAPFLDVMGRVTRRQYMAPGRGNYSPVVGASGATTTVRLCSRMNCWT